MAQALASVPVDSEGARALFERRVGLFARILLLFGVLIQFFARGVSRGIGGPPGQVVPLWLPNAHLFVLVATAGIVWRTRSGRLSSRELRWLDAACVLLPFAFSCLGLWYVAPFIRPNLVHVISTNYVLILRAVLVPSSGRRTAAISSAVDLGVVAWTAAFYTRPGIHEALPAAVFTLATAFWCVIGVIVATVASHTIFGLRQRVSEASRLGQYTLVRKIGEGGMGVVYEARHAFLRRRTAIKLLPAGKAGQESLLRFEREVQLTSTLTHPNTVAIYDYGQSSDGVFYYAMEYLDGVDLQKLVERSGALPEPIALHVLEQVCGALAEAHGAGLIHRDIKPANVILCERGGTPGVVKVVDFGLVKRIAPDASASLSAVQLPIGTPLYMSPEAISHPQRIDARADLYALGAVGYFLVTGQHVFRGATHVEICAHHLHSAPVPPSELTDTPLSSEFEALVLQCLEKLPGKRPASAAELRMRLAELRARSAFDETALQAWWRERAMPAIATAHGSVAEIASASTVLNVELGGR